MTFEISYLVGNEERRMNVEGENWSIDENGSLDILDDTEDEIMTFSAMAWIYIRRIYSSSTQSEFIKRFAEDYSRVNQQSNG